ncbi:MAG: TetR/AcrR family transcriptional regulator [Oscillospiraceae bacterium]
MKKDYKERMVVQEWMAKALIELMKTQSYDSITVTEIAERAGVSRMTYYRNYVSKDNILISYCRYLSELFAKKMRDKKDIISEDYWLVMFSFVSENIDYVDALINSGKEKILLDIMNENAEKAFPKEQLSLAKFCVGGSYNILIDWLKFNRERSVEEMSKLMKSLVNANFTARMAAHYRDCFNKLK